MWTIIGISLGAAFVSGYILYLQYRNDMLKLENEKLRTEVWSLIQELQNGNRQLNSNSNSRAAYSRKSVDYTEIS
jgi:hypothetical protein